jgi:ribulose-5-phosphate 4-epimerase/fuculose-1-phosphate aldolase
VDVAARHALFAKVALGCRILAGEGLTRAAFGHVSVRLDDGLIAIKARGRNEEGLEFTTARDIVTVRLDGTLVEGGEGLVAPNESQIHLEIFKLRPDVRSVVHIHPAEIVALGAVGRRLLPLYGAFSPSGLKLATKTLRYYPKSLLISTAELGREVAECLGDGEACILKGHGIVTVGASIEEAVLGAIALGELAHVNWLAAAAGDPEPLDDAEIAAWDAFFARYPTRVFSGRTDTGEPAEWHFYTRRDAQRRSQGNG